MYLFNLPTDVNEFSVSRFGGYPESVAVLVKEAPATLGVAVVLDTETTGLDHANDEVIELAARKIYYDRATGVIHKISEPFQAMQQPSKPLDPAIIQITGLTDEMLAGQSIDWAAFDEYVAEAGVFIAHNAGFDRPFVDAKSAHSRKSAWGCSFAQVPWRDWFPVAKQELLTILHGYFYESHRALIDVDALIRMLTLKSPAKSGNSYFSILLAQARLTHIHVKAVGAPFDSKDVLKANGYRWDAGGRVWHKTMAESELDAEKLFLEGEVYPGAMQAQFETIPPQRMFK